MPTGHPKNGINKGWFKKENVGAKNHRWKGGKPNCETCGKKLSVRSRRFCTKHKDISGILSYTNSIKGKKNPERQGENHWNWQGGIGDIPRYQEKVAGRKRPDQCELCGAMGKICFDHDHKTGKFRGWICHRCNMALGFVKDNSELLLAMVEYLKKSR